jgi:hypothetical protein
VTLLPLTAGETMGNKKNNSKKKNPASHHDIHDLRIETSQTALDESEDPNSITPMSHPLAKAIKLSLGWKPNKRRERETPFEIQEHLAIAYMERSIQEVLFDGRMIDEASNYSVAIKLFLFILCAFFSGLPVYKQSEDFYETISKAWGRLSKSELQEVCRTAVNIFLKDTTSKHGIGDSESHQVEKLTHAIIASFQWQPGSGHHHPLKQYLESHYAETSICEDLFGKQQKTSDWSLETKLFLFGLRATLVALPFGGKPSEVVARAFGTNVTAIDCIDITKLIQELAESSVSVLGAHLGTSIPKGTNMSAIVSPQNRHEENISLPVVSPCQDKNEKPRSGFKVGDNEYYTGIDEFPQEMLNALNDGGGNSNLEVKFSGTKHESGAMIDVLIYKALQSKEKKFFSTVTVPGSQQKPPLYGCQMQTFDFPCCDKTARSEKQTL